MSEPPGVPSALGIEAVQWLPQGETITVRVQGRWRRRRPGASGQALLVIETQGNRHRFQAMPEPPSITGAAPGTWQMSFSVPASLAPERAERAWLALGAVNVPLPLPLPEEPADAPPDDEATDSVTLAQRQVRASELALERARRRALEAEAVAQELSRWIAELEDALHATHHEPERLKALIAERDRAQRAAEQRAHAERARRLELQEELSALRRDAAADRSEELAAQELRIRELEGEIERLRRAADEAEHSARAALSQRTPSAAGTLREPALPRVAVKFELRTRRPRPPLIAMRRAIAAPAAPADPALLRRERELVAGSLAALDVKPEGGPVAENDLGSTLAALRAEFDALRGAIERVRAARADAERRAAALERELRNQQDRSARACDSIELLRAELDAIRAIHAAGSPPAASAAPTAPAPQAGEVDPERLSAALSRLREMTPPAHEPGAEPADSAGPSGGWLERALRTLARRDPASAGELLRALLPAQQLLDAELPEVRLPDDLTDIARLLAAGRMRRRLGLGLPRIRRNRRVVATLTALLRAPLTLRALYAAGVRIDPLTTFRLAAAMIDPSWTAGEQFAIAYQRPGGLTARAYLEVRAGRKLAVSEAPPERAAETTIVCPPTALLPLLASASLEGTEIQGDTRAVELVQRWLERAQRD